MTSALAGTPLWVWLLLAYTVWAGVRAARPRTLGPAGIVVLPGVLLLVSAYTVLGGAADGSGAALSWALGLVAGAAGGWLLGSRSGAHREGDLLLVPGSWGVLAASLAFFGVQYWIGFLRATNPSLLREWPLAAVVPAASALGAGFLAGRAGALLWRFGRTGHRGFDP